MSHYGLKISKSESPDKVPYTVYYPHNIPVIEREKRWTQPYYQIASIDPARKNYAFRIERRYHNGWITPIVFDKVAIESFEQSDNVIIYNTYQVLTAFLDKYAQYYNDCHFIIIERQLPQNYKATRIAQHSISYFSIKLHNNLLLPSIIEVDPKLKGKMLGAPKAINDKQLKSWAVEKAHQLLTIRRDEFSLQVLACFKNKQDDLSDTVCQAEALFICWGLLPTTHPPNFSPETRLADSSGSTFKTLQIAPVMVISNIDNFNPTQSYSLQPPTTTGPITTKLQSLSLNRQLISNQLPKHDKILPLTSEKHFKQGITESKILSFINMAPVRQQTRPITLNVTPIMK